MTMPFERTWAVTNTREFLYELLDPKKTPRIPKSVRLRAGRLLKHYPTELDMDDAAAGEESVFATKLNMDNAAAGEEFVFGCKDRPIDEKDFTVPDKWVMLKIQSAEETLYKVLGSWHGGYLYGDSWRLNSGICKAEETEGCLIFYGYSGSRYLVHDNNYGTHLESEGVIRQMQQIGNGVSVEVMPAETNWLSLTFDDKTTGALT